MPRNGDTQSMAHPQVLKFSYDLLTLDSSCSPAGVRRGSALQIGLYSLWMLYSGGQAEAP